MSDPDLPPDGPSEQPSEETPKDTPEETPNEPGERPELDIDAEFAAIVAAWETDGGDASNGPNGPGRPAKDPVARWPVSEDLPGDEEKARDETGPSVAAPPERDAPTVWRQGPDPLAEPVQMSALAGGAPDGRGGTEAEEVFTPPEPLPLGRGDLWLRAAWVSVFGGPLFLIACLFLMEKPLATWTIILGVGGFVGGFAVLVARMPASRDGDDDDGAVV